MSASDMSMVVEGLTVTLSIGQHRTTVVDNISLDVGHGECVAIVGESGSGKSVTLRALMGLLPPGAVATARHLQLGTADGGLTPFRPDTARGSQLAMVFQEPMAALNPTMRVGSLIAAGVRARFGTSRRAALARAIELMVEVGIPDAARRASSWPWELSGGLQQRVMIAMALSCEPRVLLCDEPTTALDVSVQDQVLGLLDRLRRDRGLAIVFVTHDLAVVAQIAERVAVMYGGRIVESGPTERLLRSPVHPYTAGLLAAAPVLDRPIARLSAIPGAPPDPRAFPPGCRFAPRCLHAEQACVEATPQWVAVDERHGAACPRARLAQPEPTRR